eukprot:11146919-Alexandrium_andersonii.AAC.1
MCPPTVDSRSCAKAAGTAASSILNPMSAELQLGGADLASASGPCAVYTLNELDCYNSWTCKGQQREAASRARQEFLA